jgi:hypothetical protein
LIDPITQKLVGFIQKLILNARLKGGGYNKPRDYKSIISSTKEYLDPTDEL